MTTAGTKGVPRADRERQILDVATAQFGEHGYAGTSLATVASRAGISKPLVLAYFGSKDGLYEAAVERASFAFTTAVETALAAGGTPPEQATRVLAAIFTVLEPRPHDWNVIMDRTTPPGSPARTAARTARAAIAEQAARGVAAARGEEGIGRDDLDLLTDVWMNTVSACVRWWLRHPSEDAGSMAARSARVLALAHWA